MNNFISVVTPEISNILGRNSDPVPVAEILPQQYSQPQQDVFQQAQQLLGNMCKFGYSLNEFLTIWNTLQETIFQGANMAACYQQFPPYNPPPTAVPHYNQPGAVSSYSAGLPYPYNAPAMTPSYPPYTPPTGVPHYSPPPAAPMYQMGVPQYPYAPAMAPSYPFVDTGPTRRKNPVQYAQYFSYGVPFNPAGYNNYGWGY
jgi:hypothetical protein